jgi:hypothetical protein
MRLSLESSNGLSTCMKTAANWTKRLWGEISEVTKGRKMMMMYGGRTKGGRERPMGRPTSIEFYGARGEAKVMHIATKPQTDSVTGREMMRG